MKSHPHLCERQVRTGHEFVRTMVYAPEPELAAWIDAELRQFRSERRICRTVGEVVTALLDAPPPRPLALVVDFDAMGPGELLHLHAIREGWFGVLFGVGVVPQSLRSSLRIHRVIPRHRPGALLESIGSVAFTARTMRIGRMP